ncbi:MAG: hypothetical protein HS108_11575 [Planctomycetes bacterium]|jgi:heptose I phosphotransferase|nr:hypothetical protein [Planctomycetota bacterium]MCL4731485.1 hypothetical protein [Planctomycetota bacterium]
MPDPRNVEITADPAFEAQLREAGLLDLGALFTRADLVPVKTKLAERQTLKLALPGGMPVYIKRYPKLRKPGLLGRASAPSPARREWMALTVLGGAGVPTIRPLALLEECQGRHTVRAALITLGLDAPHTLEDIARTAAVTAARKHAITRELARITRRMHDAGINHRDYYLVHIRVGAGDTLHVTDLNRADLRKVVPERWVVKDLAALHFSAPNPPVSRTDRARFLRAYTGKRLRHCRSLVRAITRKAERMRRHTGKKVAAGAANYHLPEAGPRMNPDDRR